MAGFTENPYNELREKQEDARRERREDEYRADLLDLKRQLNRSRRRRENIALALVSIVTAALVFAAWCMYHVLKAKGWLP